MAKANISEISCFNEEHKSEKTVHKRRSLIFHTRVISCDQYEDKTTKNDINKLISNVDQEEYMDIKTFNLKEYIEKLRQERKDWQQEYKNRKNQRKTLIKRKANIQAQGQTLDMTVLTESERAFLVARPNYEHICGNSQRLLDVALKISTISQLVQSLNERFVDRMENNISIATRNIIEISEK